MKAWILAGLLAISSAGVYSYNDVIHDIAPNRQGAAAAEEFLRVFRNVATGLKVGDKAKAFEAYMMEHASRFQLDELHQSGQLKDLPNGCKGLVFKGTNQEAGYTFESVDPDASTSLGRGDFVTEFGMKRNESCPYGGPSFSSYMDIKANTMRISGESGVRLQEGMLKVIDPANFHDLQALRTRQDRHIKMEALMVLKEFYEKFPNMAKIVQVYTFPLHSEIVTKFHEGNEYTVQNFRVFLRLDALKKDYPYMTAYLERFRDLYRHEMAVKNLQGHFLAKVALESQKDIISISMLTREGKVVPFDENNLPVFSEEILLSQLRDFEFTTSGSLFVNVFGIQFVTENINASGHYKKDGPKSSLTLRLTNMDKTRLFGEAQSNVPKWVDDLKLPKNVDDLLFGFTQLLVNANNGQGSMLALEWDDTDPENNLLHLRASTELLDNFYVRFAVATIHYCFRTDGETRTDMEAFLIRALNAIIADAKMYKDQAG